MNVNSHVPSTAASTIVCTCGSVGSLSFLISTPKGRALATSYELILSEGDQGTTYDSLLESPRQG